MATKLTKEQKEKFQAWLKEVWIGQTSCPTCTKNAWSISDHVVTPVIFDTETTGMALGGEVYPQILVVCENCGHTIYMNIMKSGIELGKTKEETKEEAEDG